MQDYYQLKLDSVNPSHSWKHIEHSSAFIHIWECSICGLEATSNYSQQVSGLFEFYCPNKDLNCNEIILKEVL